MHLLYHYLVFVIEGKESSKFFQSFSFSYLYCTTKYSCAILTIFALTASSLYRLCDIRRSEGEGNCRCLYDCLSHREEQNKLKHFDKEHRRYSHDSSRAQGTIVDSKLQCGMVIVSGENLETLSSRA